ncbi:MAG TPA: DUF6502 family protein [Steroidobacteraceae bacterium]|jgi:hypothetical protein
MSETRKQLQNTLRRVLRPIVRLLIRAGIRADEFVSLARGVYVESAIRDDLGQRKPFSRERVALVTGLTCRDVDNCIENEGMLPMADATLVSLLTEVLHKWHTSPDYSGPYGIPITLEFEAPAGRCFRSLLALVDSNANPDVALLELLQSGAVVEVGDRYYRAASRSFMVPDSASPQLYEHFGDRMSRFAATLEYNMNPTHPNRRLERFVMADRGLPPELVPEFERYLTSRAADFLVDLDNWLAPYAADESNQSGRVATGVDVFSFVEPDMPDTPDEPLASLIDGGSRA